MENNPISVRNDRLGETVVKALKKRHFEAYYCPAKEDAVMLAISLIPTTDIVAWGGSRTLYEAGMIPALYEHGFTLIDRDQAKDAEEKTALSRKGLFADTFLMSSNGISEDGQLINIDGIGNRIAALIYGPKQVIILAGINKVAPTIDDALARVRSTAAPINAVRFNSPTPCNTVGICSDCLSPLSVCAQMVRTRICRPAGRIKVILIGENLGY